MTKPERKNPAAVALGRLTSARKAASSARNARKATQARMAALTAAERSEQARKAVQARWVKAHEAALTLRDRRK